MTTKTLTPRVSFAERNPVTLGIVGVVVIAVLLMLAFNAHAVVQRFSTYGLQAVFAEAGGLKPGDDVRLAGRRVGDVTSVRLDHRTVLVDFRIERGLALKGQTRALIRTATALGRKYVALQTAGGGVLAAGDRIPIGRTQSAYDVTQALAQLTRTTDALDSRALADALDVVGRTFEKTPKQFARALDGVRGLSSTIGERDAQLREVFRRSAQVSTVLQQKEGKVERLVADGDVLAEEILRQRISIQQIVLAVSTLTRQLEGLVADGRTALRPALLELRQALALVRKNQANLDQALRGLGPFARTLGESAGNGPFFSAYLGNLTPPGFPVFPEKR